MDVCENYDHRTLLRSIHFFSLGSQVSLVSTDQVGDFCVVTLASLSLTLCLFALAHIIGTLFYSLGLSVSLCCSSCLSRSLAIFEKIFFFS